MAVDARIVVEGVELDFAEKDAAKLALDFAISDITDLSKIKKNTSKTITIPASKKNDQALGFGTDPNSTDPVDQKVRKSAFIEVKGTTLIEGFIKVNDRIRDKSDVIKSYKVVIVGNNGEWKEQLKELNLEDLDLSDQDHVWNKASVDASEVVDPSRIYVYPLINYGKFSGDGGATVKIEDRFPAINKLKLINRIFNGIGWKVDSSFLDGAFFSKLYMPFTQETLRHPQSFVDDRLFNAGTLADGQINVIPRLPGEIRFPFVDITSTGFFDAGGHLDVTIVQISIKNITFPGIGTNKVFVFFDGAPDLTNIRNGSYVKIAGATKSSNNGYFLITRIDNVVKRLTIVNPARSDSTDDEIGSPAVADTVDGTGEYVIDSDSIQNFQVTIRLNVVGGPSETSVQIIKTSNFFPFTKIVEQVIELTGSGVIKAFVETGYIKVNAGDRVSIKVDTGFDNAPTVVWTFLANGSSFSNDVSRKLLVNQNVSLSLQLPDMTQLQYIQGIRDTYNLFFSPNVNTRTITILPRDEFYRDSSFAEIWTDKIADGSVKVIQDLSELTNREITYGWAEDSNDAILEAIRVVTKKRFASVEFNNPNKFVKDKTNFGPSIFAATFMDRAQEIGLFSALIPKLWTENPPSGDIPDRETSFMPRILYYDGVKNLPTGEVWDFEGDIRTDFPRMFFEDDTQDNSNSLHFEDTQRSNGLQQRFWRGAQQMIDEGRIYTLSLNLNDVDINILDFRNPIFLKDGFYLIDKIMNYKPLIKTPTKVRFLKFIDIKQIATIVSNNRTLPPIDLGNSKLRTSLPRITVDVLGNISVISGSEGEALKNNSNGFQMTVMYGSGLTAGADNQMIFGRDNEIDPDALFIIGSGGGGIDPLAVKNNIFAIGLDGVIRPGGGNYVYFTDPNGVLGKTVYTDANGNLRDSFGS